MFIKLKAIIALILGRPVMYKITVKGGEVCTHIKSGGVIFNCAFDSCDVSGL